MKKINPQTISIKNLTVNYGNIKAIKNISFDFKTSQITTLIGSNGAGKTTTLKALMGLIPSPAPFPTTTRAKLKTQSD